MIERVTVISDVMQVRNNDAHESKKYRFQLVLVMIVGFIIGIVVALLFSKYLLS